MNLYLWIVIILFTFNFLLDSLAEILNLNRLSDELPSEFSQFTDSKGVSVQEKYQQAQLYQKETTRLGILQNSVFFLLTITFIVVGGLNQVDLWVRSFNWNPIFTGLAFVGTLGLLQMLIALPFSIYSTFGLESKFGFNKTTPQTFLSDLIKGLILSILLGGMIFSVILYFFENAGPLAWLYSWLGFTAVQLLLGYLAPAFILPLFNRFTPLPEGPLRDAIGEYAKSRNFRLQGIYTMDGSRRSTKSNAFFTGFGRFRKLVLYDTLIVNQTIPELVSVLAHEIGHFECKHILKSMLLSILYSGILFFALGQLLETPILFSAFRMENRSVYASLVLLALLYSPVSRLIQIPLMALSRKHEYEADAFAVRTFGSSENLISALKKMSVDHLSHLTPHPLKVILDYSHPPILERIRALKSETNRSV